MPRRDVVALIPALDCERTLGPLVAGARRHLDSVLVIDDGSGDASASVAEAAGARVIRHARNLGKGVALRTGIAAALELGPDALVLLDADGQHDPDDLPGFLAAWDARHPDLVVGARLADRESIPPARYWTNYIGSRILSRMTGYELEDSQSGYRLLAAGLAYRLELVSAGYAVESEMLIKAARLGATLEHVRIRTIYNDQGSHFRPLLDTYRISRASIYFKIFDDGP